MSRHTPGPWTAKNATYRSGRKAAEAKSVVMATTAEDGSRRIADCRDEDVWKPEEDEANARLIAAAPELFAALMELARQVDGGGVEPHGPACEEAPCALCVARDAIAKATGGDE